MKKIIPYLVAFLVVGVIVIGLVLGTFKFMNSKTSKRDLSMYGEYFNDASIKFSGKSKHYEFKIGRASFKDGKKAILVTDILQTKTIDYLKKETLVIKIKGEEYKRNSNSLKLNSLRNPLDVLTFNEMQPTCQDGVCEVEFPNEADFKKEFEVGVEYCTEDGKCMYEKMKLNYGGLFD